MTGNVPTPVAIEGAYVDEAVLKLRADYRTLLIVVSGVRGGPSDEVSDAALRGAENSARVRLDGSAPEALPEIAAWREAFGSFGVKPRQGRSSIEALLRRVDAGLPRIDRLTDLYNAVSVQYLIPIGGENLDRYNGPPRLVRATGDEPFDTVIDGEPTVVTPEVGEVVWRDDLGITCRRWNWRQCVRTRLGESTANILFILDALQPLGADSLETAGAALVETIAAGQSGVAITTRLLGAGIRAPGSTHTRRTSTQAAQEEP